MTAIAKMDIASHAALRIWTQPSTGLLYRLHALMQRQHLHPARTVVLLPYAHLRPVAQRAWAQCFPEGFAPHFETTMNWSAALQPWQAQANDVHFDTALDGLMAHDLLGRAGLGAQAQALVGLLVQTAHQLAPLAAACPPAQRPAWVHAARHTLAQGWGGAGEALQWEAAVAQIALEWVAQSGYASDVLWSAVARASVDGVVLVQGLLPDPMQAGLLSAWGEQACVLPLLLTSDANAESDTAATSLGNVTLHACADAQEEAQRVAACALRHIAAGRYPLALVSSDRALTRRVQALLDGAGVQVRDENGWKLSTSVAAAKVVACLNACAWDASTDAVLAWLKVSPAFAAPTDAPIDWQAHSPVDALEAQLRLESLADWQRACTAPRVQKHAPSQALRAQIEAVRSGFSGRRSVVQWLAQLRSALQACGLWDTLPGDAAGAQVLAVLQLADEGLAAMDALATGALWSQRRMDAAEFSIWVRQALEGASFQLPYPLREEVAIVPMSQMLARPFAALVLAGCDEVRLPASTEPPGLWTAAQRQALGLPLREALDAAARAAWWQALQTPVCDVLWRSSDEAAQALLPSPLVVQLMEKLQAPGNVPTAAQDPRALRQVASVPQGMPAPTAAALVPAVLTQGAYQDVRDCPYRFFALRQLGLAPAQELEDEVDKRDWGVWLHEVLQVFHSEAEAAWGANPTPALWRAALDAASVRVTQRMQLPEDAFLPFAAAWPAVREGYLAWWQKEHQAGQRFARAEADCRQSVGSVTLKGRIDRVDSAADGSAVLLDYKTESSAKSKARVKDPLEDTQMAFYAALMSMEESAATSSMALRAGYLNISERETLWVEQQEVALARDALLAGVAQDMERIAEGAALPALGDGAACAFCQARGLCRKDFWTQP